MECMPRAIASSIKILFIIQAQPHPDRCLLLSVTKLTSVPASYSRVKISFLINTCQMMVSISPSKQVESLTLLNMYVPKLFFFLIRIHVPSGNPHTSLHYMILGRYQLSSRMHSIKVILRLNASHPFSQMGPNHCDPGLRRSVDPTRYGILLPNEVRTGTVELPSQDFLIKGHVNRRHHHAWGSIPIRSLLIGITNFSPDPLHTRRHLWGRLPERKRGLLFRIFLLVVCGMVHTHTFPNNQIWESIVKKYSYPDGWRFSMCDKRDFGNARFPFLTSYVKER